MSIRFLFTALVFVTGTLSAQQKGANSIRTPIGVAWGFSYGHGSLVETFMPTLREHGINMTKLYLFWQQIEPTRGEYNWAVVDAFLSQMQDDDKALIAVWSASTWATRISTVTLPPSPAKSLDEYYQFVYNLVRRCKGRIKYWQNDCEPNNPVYWNGSRDEFLTQLKVFYKAVKDADPGASVVVGGYDGLFNPPGMWEYPNQAEHLAFFDYVIKKGSSYFDVFDLRLYADPYTIPQRVAYFRNKLNQYGDGQPIICTEYNGPGFYAFPPNMDYISMAIQWQQSVSTLDTLAYNSIKNPLVGLYDSISSLAPETQMFMMNCDEELDKKYYRLQSRDIVIRNTLALASGVLETFYWDLWHDTNDPYNLMTLMYGKNKLMDYENDVLSKKYLHFDVLSRLALKLGEIEDMRQIIVQDKPSIFLFRVDRVGEQPLYIVWERRDDFYGEDKPPVHVLLPIKTKGATAVDLFGSKVQFNSLMSETEMEISANPVFIEIY